MMNQTVQSNKCYVKWSTIPIRKQKAMLHNGIHINYQTWMQLAKMNTKLAKKAIRLQVSIQCILDDFCPFSLWPFWFVAVSVCGLSVCGRFGLWPFRFVAVSVCGLSGLWPFRSVAVSVSIIYSECFMHRLFWRLRQVRHLKSSHWYSYCDDWDNTNSVIIMFTVTMKKSWRHQLHPHHL